MGVKTILLLATLSLLSLTAVAQTTINPDISLIGDIRAFSHNDPASEAENEKLNLSDPQLELMVSGYLNPYARADAVLAWHGDENAEIEEAYATILRGLPLNANLKVGKYLLEFGRLNPVHEHAWSFVKRPLPHAAFFGHHGLADMAIRTSFLLPTGNAYTEVMAGLLKGEALIEHHHHDDEEHEHEGEEEEEELTVDRYDLGFFGRLATSFAVSDFSELALGASVVNSVYGLAAHEGDEAAEESTLEPDQLRAWVSGVDVKYKHRPSRYTQVQIEAEGLWRSDEQHDGDRLNSYGGYGYVDYRFRQKYNVGGILEYVTQKSLEHDHDAEEEHHHVLEQDTWRAGLFVGFAPVEETSLVRLTGHWTEPEDSDGIWEVGLQFIFSLGPHQPHNF